MILFVFATGVLLLNLASVKGESEPQDVAVTATPDYSEPEDDDSAVTATPDYSEWTTPDYDYNVTFEYDFYTEKPLEDDSTQEVSNPTGGSPPQTYNKTSEPEDGDSAVTATPDYSEPEDDDSAVTATPDYSEWITPDYDYNVTFEYDFYTEKPLEDDSAHELTHEEVSNPTGGSTPQTYSINKTSEIGLLTASVLLGLAVQQIL